VNKICQGPKELQRFKIPTVLVGNFMIDLSQRFNDCSLNPNSCHWYRFFVEVNEFEGGELLKTILQVFFTLK